MSKYFKKDCVLGRCEKVDCEDCFELDKYEDEEYESEDEHGVCCEPVWEEDLEKE